MEKYVNEKREVYDTLISFLDQNDEMNETDFFDFLKTKKLDENKLKMENFIYLLSSLCENHKRSSTFFQIICKILCQYQAAIDQFFTNRNLIHIFGHNNLYFLYIYAKKINANNNFLEMILKEQTQHLKDINSKYSYSGVQNDKKKFPIGKYSDNEDIYNDGLSNYNDSYDSNNSFSNERTNNESDIFNKIFNDFETKKEAGENESFVCQIIREDLIDDFVKYSNQTNISLSMTISKSKYETNPFLLKQAKTSLIEYSAFFGSIQIFQYLRLNGVELTPTLWLYAVHGRNAELIHLLEESHVQPEDRTYESVLMEAMKCHHNEIAFYVKENLMMNKIDENEINVRGIEYNNYSFFPDDFKNRSDELYDKIISYDAKTAQMLLDDGFIDVFENCSIIEEIRIPSFIRQIYPYSFHGCVSLTKVSIPLSVTIIGNNAFNGCKMLNQINIPSSVTLIGESAFSNCTSLNELVLPNSIQTIEASAFSNCSSLTKMTIPSSVVSIKRSVFNECSSLEQITFENPSVLLSVDRQIFDRCQKLKTLIISESVTKIEDLNFHSFKTITTISIPSSIQSIGSSAFKECSSLTKVIFEKTSKLLSIGESAFSECYDLKQITIPSSVASIGNNAFAKCSSLSKILFEEPSSLTSLSDCLFYQCVRLKQISFPSSLVSIGNSAFQNCVSLTKLEIPSSVATIGPEAFKFCKKLKEINLPSNLTEIDQKTFSECSALERVEIPSNIIKVNNNAFYKCISLNNVLIHSTETYLDAGAFRSSRNVQIKYLNKE